MKHLLYILSRVKFNNVVVFLYMRVWIKCVCVGGGGGGGGCSEDRISFKFWTLKSHYLRGSYNLHYGLEIEKIDAYETLPIFNFCPEVNKNAYIFFTILHFRFHGNHHILFLEFSALFWIKNYYILDYPTQGAAWQMFVFVLSYNNHG